MRSLCMLAASVALASAARADFPEPSKLPSHADFPDPLVMFDGTKVTTKEQWEKKRRPELKALFQHYMYGTYPLIEVPSAGPPGSKVLHEDTKAFGGKATL